MIIKVVAGKILPPNGALHKKIALQDKKSMKTASEKILGRVLVVDDDQDMLDLLAAELESRLFLVDRTDTLSTMKTLVRQHSYDAILLDLVIDRDNALELLPYLAREAPFTKVVIMTAYGSVPLAVEATHKGASDFILKGDSVQSLVDRFLQHIPDSSAAKDHSMEQLFQEIGLVGRSEAFCQVLDMIARIRSTDAHVLILGESGTGKELVARAIHRVSTRRRERFIALNCAAIPETLLESELFGYTKGAFTDARSNRKGIFESCSDGTLLLDEIGELPLNLQAKILRVLQEHELTPLGSTQSIKVNTRIIAATHRDLEEETLLGRFREDLYFRLNIIPIYLPSLRERKGDIEVLTRCFIERFNKRYDKSIGFPSRDILARLEAYDWRGNIRELQNAIERAVVLSKDDALHIEDILARKNRQRHNAAEGQISASIDFETNYAAAKEAFERAFLVRLMGLARGSIAEAARLSGRYRSDIYRLMTKYGIDAQNFK
jgi:DNA-binding NtrC family response regulator